MLALVLCTACAPDDPEEAARQPGQPTTVPDSAAVIRPGMDPSAPVTDTATGQPPAGPAPAGNADEQQPGPRAVAGAGWTVGDTRIDRPITGAALVREMRTARHPDFDRIVLDFGADAVPPYRISYIDRPVRQCGSGDTVPFAGDAWLSIVVEPANAHTEQGAPTVTPRERAPGLPSLLVVKLICDFEAVVEIVAGVRSPEQYRAFVLGSPNRLVVDIRHPGE